MYKFFSVFVNFYFSDRNGAVALFYIFGITIHVNYLRTRHLYVNRLLFFTSAKNTIDENKEGNFSVNIHINYATSQCIHNRIAFFLMFRFHLNVPYHRLFDKAQMYFNFVLFLHQFQSACYLHPKY